MWKSWVEPYTVGALVQANYGDRRDLRIDGVPVGRRIPAEMVPLPGAVEPGAGSIIIVIATDAPLLPYQCSRLAQRATVGLARIGGIGHNGSGDIFLAFATGNHLPHDSEQPVPLQLIPNRFMNPLFYATIEAVEESILNAIAVAETMTGFRGRTVHALPQDELQRIWHAERP